MEHFDIVRNPLAEGPCLIEAGAGTGKTYALTAIFLRLLIEKHIEPDRILVVTFSTAATAELRDRLRRQLIAVRRFLDGEGPLDDTLRALIERIGPGDLGRARVVTALREFDRIAIFTIHGFCQRLLTEMAFETDSPFMLDLLADPTAWIQSAADDYWRAIFDDTDPELAAHALDQLGGPESLARLYQRFRMPDLRIVPAPGERPRIDFRPYRQGCARLHRQWPLARDAVADHLTSPALKGNVYGALKPPAGASPAMSPRHQKVAAWCRSLDFFLRQANAPFPPSSALVYFSAAKIAAATRKGQSPPRHPFFDACQALSEAALQLHADLEAWTAALRYGFFTYADRRIERQKQERQTIFYDDLLTRTAKALKGSRGRRLAATVRRRYRAALVDEFQDTDSTQYRIFQNLFGGAAHHLMMIGDPKQAIYGFRGADIFSYLEASRQSQHRFTLIHNWRSRPELIQAVNALFENHAHPFMIPEIKYYPAVAARAPVGDNGCAAGQGAMTFWLMTNDGTPTAGRRGGLTKAQATTKILAALAVQVARLLQPEPPQAPAGPGGTPRDIAILVRTNRQARQVKDVMTAAGIPAVIHNAGNVFGTTEADELTQVLNAVAQPNDSRRLKTALVTRLFGWTGPQLVWEDLPPPRWEAIQQRFMRYQTIWEEIGFYPFFRRMLVENRMAERLLRLTDGERRLTNLLHLGELLNQAAMQQRTGPRGTLKWLNDQCTALSGSLEEQQLRMESDAQALTILTIHKSKGLEFPIVFCPFCWESEPVGGDWPLFHDPAADMRRTLDLGSPALSAHRQQAQVERLAESLRLLYVAITRAQERCFLVWGALPGVENSALAYLLDPVARQGRAVSPDGHADRAAQSRGPYTDEDAAAALDWLRKVAGGTVAVKPLPEWTATQRPREAPAPPLQAERAMRRRFDPYWAITSFSALTHASDAAGEDSGDRDPVRPPPATIAAAEDEAAAKLADNMHRFPGGTVAGNFFHRLFEMWDYRRIDPQGLQTHVATELDRFGFDRQWVAPVARLIVNVLTTPLTSAATPFCLNSLAPRDCVKELPFCFPLNRLKAQTLRQFYTRQDLALPAGDIDHQLEKLNFVISGGYLRGFVDLVFRVRGRYFVLDWKSNLLGSVYADYGPERIRKEMTAAYYFLQYHIYALALHQFLGRRLPDYAYNTHFGGVYYLFIRGMRPEHGTASGVFFDRPATDLIHALAHLLVNTETSSR